VAGPLSERDDRDRGRPLTGGCLCAAVRYEASGEPYHSGYCHCVTCRRASGAPVVAWFSVKLKDFRLLQGETRSFESSDHGRRRHCGSCGTQLFFDDDDFPDEIDITNASLDEPERVPPDFHLYDKSRIDWVRFGDGLRHFDEKRQGERQ
jgi:hypothetical protein